MYYYSFLHELLLLNFGILIRQRFVGMSFSTQWALNFVIQAFSTLNNLNYQKFPNHEQIKFIFRINFKGKLEQAKRTIFLKINF